MSSNGSKNETKASSTAVKNAWSKPLQPKPGVSPPPGMGGKTLPAATSTSSPAATLSSSRSHTKSTSEPGTMLTEAQASLRERFLSLIVLAVGQSVTATLSDGTKLEGILNTATPFPVQDEKHRNKYVFKQVNVLEKGQKFQFEKGGTAILDMQNVVNVMIQNLRLDAAPTEKPSATGVAGAADSFRTDTEISAAAGTGRNKSLEAAGSAWTGGAGAPSVSLNGPARNSRADALMKGSGEASNTVAGSGSLQGNIGGWDQFEANKTLFNVEATYDENLYTTSLDKSKIDAQKIRRAEKIAKEIESQTTSNIHLAEERGLKLETDFDEEDLYSGVIKSDDKAQVSQSSKKDGSQPKMNYAAAAAKQTLPPGFGDSIATNSAVVKQTPAPSEPTVGGGLTKTSPPAEATATEAPDVKAEQPSEVKIDLARDEVKKETSAPTDTAETASQPTVSKPKLNPNAKEFSLNISAKPFTPSFATEQAPPPVQPPQMPYGAFDPATGMPIQVDPNVMHAHPYMQHGAPMAHPGMIGIMGQPYPGVRYPGQFTTVDQQQQQQSHILPAPTLQPAAPAAQQAGLSASHSTHASGAPSPMTTSEEDSQPAPDGAVDNESQTSSQAPPQAQHQPIPQQNIPSMPYSVPPNYYGQMPMHPQQHGMPFPPHPYGMPQQMPGGPMFRQGYPMPPNMPANMMRPYPYGPGGPIPYQQYGYEEMDGYRGGRGRGRGRGAGGGGRHGGGRGNRNHMNGRGQGGGRSYPNQHGSQQLPGNAPAGTKIEESSVPSVDPASQTDAVSSDQGKPKSTGPVANTDISDQQP